MISSIQLSSALSSVNECCVAGSADPITTSDDDGSSRQGKQEKTNPCN